MPAINPLLLDLLNELAEAEAEASLLEQAIEQYFAPRGEPRDTLFEWLIAQGAASVIEKIYSGYESIMNRVASVVDGLPIKAERDWHVVLLRRMTNPNPGVRPRLLSPATMAILDQLRMFRHRERNTYGTDLLLDRVLDNAAHVRALLPLFRADLDALIAFLTEV